jgi:dynein heavy chain, axonemal
MSKCYKELGYHQYQTIKWVVLDGDIDAVWIESMNSECSCAHETLSLYSVTLHILLLLSRPSAAVMDDNKMLTLVSNERIPLSPAMRMMFEVNSLANASPATVSRAGILFINETDIGWRPFAETWMQCLPDESLRAHLPGLFDKYIEPLADGTRKMKSAVPLPLINQVRRHELRGGRPAPSRRYCHALYSLGVVHQTRLTRLPALLRRS